MSSNVMGFASLALNAIGTGLSARQQVTEGATSQAIADRTAVIADQNAIIAKNQAVTEEFRIRRGAEKLKGKQRVAFAASGVDIGTGSPLLVLADTARQAEIDAMTVRTRGAIEEAGFKEQAVTKRYSGKQAYKAGKTGAFATILSGAGRALSTGLKFKQAGVS